MQRLLKLKKVLKASDLSSLAENFRAIKASVAKLRNLTAEEVAVLEKNGNRCEDWKRVLVEPNFDPARVQRSVFMGDVRLPAFYGTLLLPGDVSFPTGIYDSLVHNCIVENALVYKVSMLSNVLVRSSAVVHNVGTLVSSGKINFMIGSAMSVGNEMGGRELLVFPDITMDLVEAQLFHKAEPDVQQSFEEMLEAYQTDIAEVEAGDDYGNNIVELYDPTNYIGAEGTSNPTWARILMGASEGDISMFNSLNLEIAWLNAGTDAEIEWQWNGGHVPSEIFGDSLALYVDIMYGKYVEGAVSVEKEAAEGQTENGTAEEATGTDLSGWVSYDSESGASFSLADAAAYRTAGASKAIPGFDVIDYGQEDYVFGSSMADARHWDRHVLEVLEENQDVLSELFNK